MSDHATTGDGILTALHVLERMAAHRPVARRRWPSVMTRLPAGAGQRPGRRQGPRRRATRSLAAAVAEEEAELGDTGRVLLRPSGTEPLVRVMVEAATPERARDVADRLADVVTRAVSDPALIPSRPALAGVSASPLVSIEIRELDRQDEAQVRAFWEVARDAVADRARTTTILAWQAAKTYIPMEFPDRARHFLAAWDGDRMVGAGAANASTVDNLHLA